MFSIKLASFVRARACGCAYMSTTSGPWYVDSKSDIKSIVYPQYSPKDKSESLIKKRARLTWQSRKRGIKENCLIFATFANEHLKSFSLEQLNLYDDLLNKADNEWDLYYWMTGNERVPEMFDNEIMDLLKKHCQNDETSSSGSDSEDLIPLKRKRLTAKVVELMNKLEKEDKSTSEEELGIVECNPGVLLDKDTLNTASDTTVNAASCHTIQIEDIKAQNIKLQEKQDILKHSFELAVHKKNFDLAENLSDQISNNELSIKSIETVVQDDYRSKLRVKEELKVKRKRKKLDWVFGTKKKWETKANM